MTALVARIDGYDLYVPDMGAAIQTISARSRLGATGVCSAYSDTLTVSVAQPAIYLPYVGPFSVEYINIS